MILRTFVKITRMNTKLTLSLEKDIIDQAKIYAKGTGRSLSEMVENYFKNLIAKPNKNNINEDVPMAFLEDV